MVRVPEKKNRGEKGFFDLKASRCKTQKKKLELTFPGREPTY